MYVRRAVQMVLVPFVLVVTLAIASATPTSAKSQPASPALSSPLFRGGGATALATSRSTNELPYF